MIIVTIVQSIVIFLIVAILIAYIYLISLKLRSRNFKRKNHKWKEENRKFLYEFIMHNKCHDFKIEHTADIHALESLCIKATQLVSGIDEKQRIHHLLQVYLFPHYKEKLVHGTHIEKQNILDIISFFKIKKFENEVKDICTQTSGSIQHQAFTTLSTLNTRQAILLATRVHDAIPNTMIALSISQTENFSVWVEFFYTLPKQFQYEILNAIGTREENSCYLFLIQNLMNEDEEIIIRSLHAISKLMPKTETKEHIEHLFKKDSWQIHLMLIRVITPFKDEGYFPYLLEQAGHQSWWVRREVQHAIQYYSNWQEKYIEIALHHPDRFARESALEALARKDVTTYALS
ncbi:MULTISPECIES: HEAT repeat domain-containing protein [unclassified Bacillus cereus group]|nr:MAG: HEAT repeat domain-containing protein [Bacillus paranthracis]